MGLVASENHEVKEEDKIELLLFCDWEKKIEKRKKYLEDLWRERSRRVKLRCDGDRGADEQKHP